MFEFERMFEKLEISNIRIYSFDHDYSRDGQQTKLWEFLQILYTLQYKENFSRISSALVVNVTYMERGDAPDQLGCIEWAFPKYRLLKKTVWKVILPCR